MAVDFYVTVPSNSKTNMSNKTNSFTVRLQKKLQFNSTWVVGLVSILYPYSWPTVGTSEFQHVDVTWKGGVVTRLYIKSTAYRTLDRLFRGIESAIRDSADKLCALTSPNIRKRRAADDNTPPNDTIKKPRNEGDEEEEEEQLHPPLDPELLAEKSVVTLTHEKKQLEEKLSKAKTDLEDLQRTKDAEIKKLKADVKKLDDKVKLLKAGTQSDHSTILTLTGKLDKAEKKLLDAEDRFDEEKRLLNDQITNLGNQITALETAKKTAEDSNQELASQVLQLTTAKNQAEETLTRKERDLKDANDLLATQETQRQQLQEKLDQLEGKSGDFTPSPMIIAPPGCSIASGEPYSKLADYVKLHFDEGLQRFAIKINPTYVESVSLSEQLAYTLGFDKNNFTEERNEAKYMPDLHGGVHSLYVTAPKLVEPSIVGDTWSPLLRIAKVKGQPGDHVEDVFLAPQYHKLLEKEVSEISIQIRTNTGRLVPFNWGNCTLVLHFKKLSLF